MTSKLTVKSSALNIKHLTQAEKKALKKLHLKTIGDVLTCFPFRYMDYQPNDIQKLPDKSKVAVTGRICNLPKRIYHKRLNITNFKIAYNHERKSIWVSFFNMPWLIHNIHKNDSVTVYGTYRVNGYFHSVSGSKIAVNKTNDTLTNAMKPQYPKVKGLAQSTIQKLVHLCYTQYSYLIHNVVPEPIRERYKLEDESTVIHDMQFPKNSHAEALARRTEKFNELYSYESKIAKMRQNQRHSKGIAIHFNKKVMRNFDNSLPFKLTSGQLRSVNEIVRNLADDTQMNRLLQGDVGSGKTIVAAFGILATISAGYQAAIMIPTSVLGEQHYKSFKKIFKGLHINIVLVTGGMKVRPKRKVDKEIASGKADLVIGTDALIQKSIKFKKLGMVVIDEQHKFGVDQRKALVNKGKGVNALAMTATPIPRTLQITAYGNMDVSIIDTLPKGRKPIKTKWIHKRTFDHNAIYTNFIKTLLAHGQQVYCVVPLVKQNTSKKKKHQTKKEKQNLRVDAVSAFNKLQKKFVGYTVGLLHGQMDNDEKDKILADFKSDKIQLLVSTTVVEVGVDAPKATMMVIFNADSFGLSTLHQLRGRVGRNSMQSYCLLIADPKSKDGVKRMRVMENTNNGFYIAQADLRLRGAGNIFGETQAGIPKFKVADAVADNVMLKYARIEATKVTKQKANPQQESMF